MRAFEFLKEDDVVATGSGVARLPSGEEVKITIPVTINMEPSDGGDVNITPTGAQPGKVNTTIAAPATTQYPDEPIWITPGQQVLELQKQAGGKTSPLINQIIKSDNGPDSDPNDGVFADLDDGDVAEDDKRSIYNDCALQSGK